MSKLKRLRNRLFLGALIWLVATPILAVTVSNSFLFRILVVTGWLILFIGFVKYMVEFFFVERE